MMDSNIFLIKYEGYLDYFILERSFPTLVWPKPLRHHSLITWFPPAQCSAFQKKEGAV